MIIATNGAGSRAPSGRRADVLRILKERPGPLSINDIADELSVHPNTVRFHLERLVELGQVKRVRSDRRVTGRPPLLFGPVRRMDPTGPRQYQVLAELLVQSLATGPDRTARAVEAGQAWGLRHGVSASAGEAREPAGPRDSVDRLVELLDGIGFAPETRVDGRQRQIGLRHCPFLELAEVRSEVVCPVHLGLMQGAMEAWQSPVTVDRLESFVEPDLCLAHLTT